MPTKAEYRKQIIDKRLLITKEREAKKRDNERYARAIKSASTPDGKAYQRKQKISTAEQHDRRIEGWKKDVARLQEYMKNCTK